MATYNRVTPANLTGFSAVIDTPLDSEDSNKLAQVDLQTRRFVYDFLASKFDATASDVLLAAAVAAATVAGKINGSTANLAGTQRAIVQGTISTPDLRDGSISTDKLADVAVTAAKIALATITNAQINVAPNGVAATNMNDDSVPTRAIVDDAVTAAKLADSVATDADRAVTTNHIRDDAITAAKIADGAVGADALAAGTEAQMLIAGTTGKFVPKTVSGAITIDKDGVTTLASTGYACLRELAANTVACGAASATTWHTRGDGAVVPAWTKDWETLAMVTLGAGGKVTLAAGTYLIEAFCPAYKVGKHVCRIEHKTSAGGHVAYFDGTAEDAPAAAAVQTVSHVYAKIVFTGTNSDFYVQHYTTGAEVADGLGVPVSAGATNEVYSIVKIHKIA